MRKKLIATFLVASVAIGFSWVVTQMAFDEVKENVASLTRPNEKLRIVNELFRSLSQQELQQRAEVLKGTPKFYESFFRKQEIWQGKLDSLKLFYRNDTAQTLRLDSMKSLLIARDQQLIEYLKFKMELLSNKALSKNLDMLSDYLVNSQHQADSSIVSTEHITTTTTFVEPAVDSAKNKSFFKRIFRRKKTEPPVVRQQVQQDVHVTIDTIAIAQRDSLLTAVGLAFDKIEKDQNSRSESVIRRELQLANSNSLFLSQLINLLRGVEKEEMNHVVAGNGNVQTVISRTINRIGIIFLVFFVFTILLILMILVDIYRSNNYRLQLIDAKDEAERLSTIKQRFLANISHELRTPLQAILGFSEQAMQQVTPKREGLRAIHDSSEHLLQIVNEILDYSRIVSGKFTFEKQDFNAKAILEEVARTMELQAGKKGIEFQFHSDIPADQFYSGDSFRLKQVLYNLLGNAIKFTDKGQVSLLVQTDIKPKKTRFNIEIRDTGIGISKKDQERVFNLFEQASGAAAHTHSGTGLGLSIVKSLVEMQGGSVELESEEGKGSVFKISLTYLHAKPVTVPEEIQVINIEQPVYKGKVLLVDDDALILQLCSGILEKHRIRHVSYNSPLEILAQPWDPQITFVLLDIRMPGMSGMELCRQIREMAGNEVRIYSLTAQAFPEEKAAMLLQGFDGVLSKPFREQELLQVITGKDAVVKTVISSEGQQEQEVDLMSIVKMSMGDKELLAKNIAILKTTTEEDVKQLETYIQQENAPEVLHYVHRLAGKTGMAGARSLALELRQQEKKLERDGLLKQELSVLVQLCERVKRMTLAIEQESKQYLS